MQRKRIQHNTPKRAWNVLCHVLLLVISAWSVQLMLSLAAATITSALQLNCLQSIEVLQGHIYCNAQGEVKGWGKIAADPLYWGAKLQITVKEAAVEVQCAWHERCKHDIALCRSLEEVEGAATHGASDLQLDTEHCTMNVAELAG